MALTGDALADELDNMIGANAESLGIQGWLDTGIPELNHILSGNYNHGAPLGRMIEIFGGASCGKTFLATMIMAAAQRQGGIAFFADHERSFEPILAQTLGLDMDKSKFRYLRPQTFEESMERAVQACELIRQKGLIAPDAPLVWVFDSVASMIPHSKLYDDKGKRREVGTYNMRDKLALATATSQSYPALAQFAEDNRMTVLLLNQIRLKPGVMYGDPTTTPGGMAAEFYASTRLSLGRTEITNGKKGKDKEVWGFNVSAQTVKNKVARPFQKASWQVRFNDGLGVTIDRIATNLDFMVRKGIIEKSGNYLLWDGKKKYQSAVEKELKADPEGLAKLMAMMPAGDVELEDVAETEYTEPEKTLDDVLGDIEV